MYFIIPNVIKFEIEMCISIYYKFKKNVEVDELKGILGNNKLRSLLYNNIIIINQRLSKQNSFIQSDRPKNICVE